MLEGKKIVVVLPAYDAEKTLEKTYNEIPKGFVDEILLVDDFSNDKTVEVAHKLGIKVVRHYVNKGYGANQKTCYSQALLLGADIIVMLHPDYQYPPRLIIAMAGLVSSEMFDVVIGSRILGGLALKGGMPLYKYVANRFLTTFENVFIGQKLSEYHSGYRAFSREVLLNLPLLENSDDFVFDNEMIVQSAYFGYRIGEITAPANYAKGCSSISFRRSIVYGFSVVVTVAKFLLQKLRIVRFSIFDPQGAKIELNAAANT